MFPSAFIFANPIASRDESEIDTDADMDIGGHDVRGRKATVSTRSKSIFPRT